MPICIFIVSSASILNILGEFFNVVTWLTLLVLDLVLYLWITVSFHSDVTSLWFFYFLDHMGLWFWCIHFYFSILSFGNFPIFGVTVKFLLLISWKNIVFFFAGFTGWSSYGYASKIGNLRGSALVNVFIGIRISFGLFLGSPLGVSLGIPPWLAPSEVLLGYLLF